MADAQQLELYFAAGFGVIYILYGLMFRKILPEFPQIATVFLAGAGIAAGGKLCILVLNPEAPDFGVLHDQKLAIFLGGFAIIWLAVDSIKTAVEHLPQKAKEEKVLEESNDPQHVVTKPE